MISSIQITMDFQHFQLVTNHKALQSLLLAGYHYTKINEVIYGHILGICHDRSCRGRVIQIGIQTEMTGYHHHPPNQSPNKVEELKSLIRKWAWEDITSIPKIYTCTCIMIHFTLLLHFGNGCFGKLKYWELTFWELSFWEMIFW